MKCTIDSSEMTLVFDSEANGLLHEVTKMWCVVAEDYHTGIMYLFHNYPHYDNTTGVDEEGNQFTLPARNGTLEDGVKFLHHAKSLMAHNCIGYDMFLMKKFYPRFRIRYAYPEIRDTLLESQVSWYDRPAKKGYKGLHNLAVWGARLGVPKPEIEDWSTMDAAKLHRCLMDVRINTLVAREMEKEFKQHLELRGADLTEAMTTEQEYRYWSTIQELNGALVDAPHMERCVVELDGLIEELRAEIEPQLPPSLDVKPQREEAHVVAKLVGSRIIPARVPNSRIRKGEVIQGYEKSMYKPTMKFQTVKKQKMYGVTLDNEKLIGHTFKKLKEAREWAKDWSNENPLSTKPKFVFPSIEVEIRGLDAHTKKHFANEIESGTEILGPFTKVEFRASKMSQHEKVKLLLVSLGWQTDEWTFLKDSDGRDARAPYGGSGGEVKWPSSPINGKQLTETYKGGEKIPLTPKMTEDSFQWLPEGFGQKIKHYNTYVHRRNFIKNPTKDHKGLLNNIRKDGRVSCGLMTFGTSVGRASHFNVVNLPSVQAMYGQKMRDIFIASEGCSLLGVDMPSCHHRYLAGRTGVQEYIDAVDGDEVEENGDYLGKDLHTLNGVLFGLTKQSDVDLARENQDDGLIGKLTASRKSGKAPGFLCIYGGSDKKMALTLGINVKDASARKSNFLSGLGLDELLNVELLPFWEERKHGRGSYIPTLGGYQVWSDSKHKVLNYCAIGAEAVIQKVAVILISRKIRDLGLSAKLIGSFHDECLFEVPNEELEVFKPISDDMYQAAAIELDLPLNWKSVSMVGATYGQCH